MFDKRFGFKCEGGKVLGVSLIDSRTYSWEKVLLMNVEKFLGSNCESVFFSFSLLF